MTLFLAPRKAQTASSFARRTPPYDPVRSLEYTVHVTSTQTFSLVQGKHYRGRSVSTPDFRPPK